MVFYPITTSITRAENLIKFCDFNYRLGMPLTETEILNNINN